jgi:hypothetical protein
MRHQFVRAHAQRIKGVARQKLVEGIGLDLLLLGVQCLSKVCFAVAEDSTRQKLAEDCYEE